MKFRIFIVIAAITFCPLGRAADAGFLANVVSVLVDDIDYAGCIVRFTEEPSDYIAGCGTDWLTLDCMALFPESTKSNAALKLSQTQLALVANRSVYVKFTDDRTANGKCFATRISVN